MHHPHEQAASQTSAGLEQERHTDPGPGSGQPVDHLRASLGDVAVRIDHVGSTAVVGLDAKPIIDVQVSVVSFEPLDAFKVPIERAGYVHRADNTERTKPYFREWA